MANRQQKGKLIVNCHAEKLKALEYCMKEKGADLEQTIADFIDGLYEKHVPKIMKGFIEPAEATGEIRTESMEDSHNGV